MVNATFSNLGEYLQGLAFATARHERGVPLTGWSEALADKFATAGSDEMATNTAGSFYIAPTFSDALLTRAFDFSRVAGRCSRLPLPKSGKLTLPAMRESSRVDGSRLGGITSHWGVETQSTSTSRGQVQALELDGKRLTVLVPVTEQLLRNGPAFNTFINRAASEELAVRVDDAIVRGGVGSPRGIIDHAATIVVSKLSGQSADTIVAENLTSMVGRLWPYSDGNAVFLCSRSAAKHITTNCKDVVRYAEPGASGDARFTICGLPAIVIEQARPLGDQGDVILADLTQYALSDSGVQASTSAHVRFEWDEQMFKFVFEVDGGSIWKEPVSPMNGETDTQSPFVVLAERA